MTRFLVLTSLLLLAACSDEKTAPASPASSPGASPGGAASKDHADAVPVLAAKAKEAGAEVAVVGRVRDTGKGIFTLVDDKFDYCGRGSSTDDACPTPWDYCCQDQEAVAHATIVVKALGPDGAPVAKSALGIRHLDLVAVKGVLTKQEDGSLAVVAKGGWFRRERPKLPDSIKFDD